MKARYGGQIAQDPKEPKLYFHGGIGASVMSKVETYLSQYGVTGEEKPFRALMPRSDTPAQEEQKMMCRVDHSMVMWNDQLVIFGG